MQLDIVSVKTLRRITVPVKAGLLVSHRWMWTTDCVRGFARDGEQKVEIPRLHATLEALLVNGHLVRCTKLAGIGPICIHD
jgi:hypothetical protein